MQVEHIIAQFAIPGELESIKTNKEGHINNTFISTFIHDGIHTKYTHQRLNRTVFTQPESVMENILLITKHLQDKVSNLEEAERRTLSLVPTKEGAWWTYDQDGELWRTYRFIDGVKTYPFLNDHGLAHRFGVAVGTFQTLLSDFDGSTLFETISNFHHMGFRYRRFEEIILQDPYSRFSMVGDEVRFFRENKARAMIITEALEHGEIPLRVTHNDTKINNVLFDDSTGEGICMIDLDTVMGGTILFDTGDMIRTGCSTAAEDEQDLSLVRFDVNLYKNLIEGYRSIADSFLTDRERLLLAESGRAITLIMGLRMLTDYLAGDMYYQTMYDNHNLVRARTQIRLIQEMDSVWDNLLPSCRKSSES